MAHGPAHDIDFAIHGADLQFVEIELDPGETAVAEAGSMMFMEQGIQMTTAIGDGTNRGLLGKLFSVGKRSLTGEKVFLTHFTNNSTQKHRVAFSAPFPGRIVPLDLYQLGGSILCQKSAFLCSAKGVAIDIAFSKRITTGLFGGIGFVLQRLQGDGLAFIHAGGTVVEKTLADGEVFYIDTGSVVAFQPSIHFDIQMVRGIKSLLFAGESMFLTTLRGPGKIWIQSMPYTRFVANLTATILNPKRRRQK